MIIALLTDGLYPFTIGGIQKHSYYLAKYWARQMVYVHVYHSNVYNLEALKVHFTEEELAYLEFKYIPHPQSVKFPGHYIYNCYHYSKKLFQTIRKQNYDAIYSQGFTGWYFLGKNAFQAKLFTNLHGIEMYQKAINLKNKIEHLLLRIPASTIIKKSEKQISLGGKLTEILNKKGAKKGSVIEIPNAIAPEWLERNELPDTFGKPVRVDCNVNNIRRFIFIGRYERRKGIEEINTVLQQLIADNNCEFEFHFVGPIPEKKRVKGIRCKVQGTGAKVKDKYLPKPQTVNLQPKSKPYTPIFYHGSITNQIQIKHLLQESDILVCPSYSEGMPTVILEAMACHCAIITTNVGASGELVNKDNGWLMEGDIVTGLKKAMKEAINIEATELLKMKNNSYHKVKEKYTWNIVAKQTLEVIKWIGH